MKRIFIWSAALAVALTVGYLFLFPVARYQLMMSGSGGFIYRLDTRTGHIDVFVTTTGRETTETIREFESEGGIAVFLVGKLQEGPQ